MPVQNPHVKAFLATLDDEATTAALVTAAGDDTATVVAALRKAAESTASVPKNIGFHLHNLEMPNKPALVSPSDRDETAIIVQRIARKNGASKGLGGAYSFSTAAWTRGTLISHDRQRGVRAEPLRNLLPKAQTEGLWRVQAGATIGDIYGAMDADGREPKQRPGFNDLTWVGASGTGAHGSGLGIGPLSAYTRAVEMISVDADRRVRRCRIEPARAPITDAKDWKPRNPDIDLIVDDDLFDAATVSFGALGIVTGMVIESQPQSRLREDRTMHTWENMKTFLPTLHADPSVHSFQIWLNPYESKRKGQKDTWCVLSRYTRVPVTTQTRGIRGASIVLGGIPVIGELVTAIANDFPERIPQLVQAAIDGTLSTDVVRPSFQALDFGAPNHLPVVACGFGVAIEVAVPAIERIVSVLRKRPMGVGWVTSTLGIRFAKGSTAHLGMQQGRDTCMIEVPILARTNNARDTLDALLRIAMDEFDARPHWGQFNSMTGADARRLYPNFDKFVAAFDEFNPAGTFDNVLTDAIGLRD